MNRRSLGLKRLIEKICKDRAEASYSVGVDPRRPSEDDDDDVDDDGVERTRKLWGKQRPKTIEDGGSFKATQKEQLSKFLRFLESRVLPSVRQEFQFTSYDTL